MTDPEDIAERLDAVDELATNTAKRLTTHIASSGEVHRDLRSRMRQLELLMNELLRQRP